MTPMVAVTGGWVVETLRAQEELRRTADAKAPTDDAIDIPREDVVDITDQRALTHEPTKPTPGAT